MRHDTCTYNGDGADACACATCIHDDNDCCMRHGKSCYEVCMDCERDPAFQSMDCGDCYCDHECCAAPNCSRCFRSEYAEPGWIDYKGKCDGA